MSFKVRYFVNTEKRIVVCKLYECAHELCCDMCHKGWPLHDALIINDEFVGKAKCSPDDNFDIEKGKELAYKRALIKLCKAKAKTLIAFLQANQKSVADLSNTVNKLCNKYDGTITKKESDIANMFGETSK